MPHDEAWHEFYADPSGVRCGSQATCWMLSTHHGRTFDVPAMYQRAVQLNPPGPGTSPWANMQCAKEWGLLADMKWFYDLATARATIAQGLAFIVLSQFRETDGHIWCVNGFSEAQQSFYTPWAGGEEPVSFTEFEQNLDWPYAACGVALF